MSTELGRGSYSAVYAADDRTAVKCYIKNGLDEGQWHATMISAIREIFICSQINHPNVIKFDRVSLTKREIRMPRYDMDMFTWLTRHKPPARVALGVMAQLACGLAAIHSADIIHADLKLQNVLMQISVNGQLMEVPTAVICDFGVSLYTTARVHPRLVQSGVWRAPEVSVAQDPAKFTQKIDIWSYGIMFAQAVFRQSAPNKLIAGLCSRENRKYSDLTPEDVARAIFGRAANTRAELLVGRCLTANARPTAAVIVTELTGRAPPARLPIPRVADGVILQYLPAEFPECIPIAESIFAQLPPSQRSLQTAVAAMYIAGAVQGEKRITRTALPPLNVLDSLLSRGYGV